MKNEERTADGLNQNGEDQEHFLQFHAQVDYRNYREFRVRDANLQKIPPTETINETIKTCVENIIEKHMNRIALLEDEIRHHHQMKRNWAVFTNVPNEYNKEIIAKIVGSSQHDIEVFEKENFGPACKWSQLTKLKSEEEMGELFSSFKKVNKYGEEITTPAEIVQPTISESATCQPTVQEEESLPIEEIPTVESVVTEDVAVRAPTEAEVKAVDIEETLSPIDKHEATENQKVSKLTKKYMDQKGANESKNNTIRSNSCSQKDHEMADKKSLLSDEQESDESADETDLGTEKSCQTAIDAKTSKAKEHVDSSMERCGTKEIPNTSSDPSKRRAQNSGKSNGKKGKKGKKGHKGPKITLEEIEAIKKKKKEETDRAFEQRQIEMKIHMSKVNKTDNNRLHRKIAETALQILRVGSGVLPPEIQQLNQQFEEFVQSTGLRDRHVMRDEYMLRRVIEVNETLIGNERFSKLDQIAAFDEVMERCEDIIPYIIFSHTMDPLTKEYADYEKYLIDYCLNGEDGEKPPVTENLLARLKVFKREVMKVHRSDQYTRAHGILLSRMIFLDAMKTNKDASDYELKANYQRVTQILETSATCLNITAFLHAHRDHPSFNLMEAWLLESKRPTPEIADITSN